MDLPESPDFFVSYTAVDVAWAEWIASSLEQSGYSTVIQAWDFQAGSNFVIAMQLAAERAQRTIAVLSPAFLASSFTQPEWAAAFADDPTGQNGKLVPVRVRECELRGLLRQVVFIDLVGLDEQAAKDALLTGVDRQRARPVGRQPFPADAKSLTERPSYPGDEPPVWNVPIATRTFAGRTDALAALDAGLKDAGRAAVTQVRAIHGLGGVGKTQLAAQYAREHAKDYDVVWWVRAEGQLTRMADFAGLGVQLRLPEAASGEQDELIAATKAWLERFDRWLLILDNVPDPASIAPLLPASGAGNVLITSRRHADWRGLGAQPVPLDVWDPDEAISYLLKMTGSSEREAAAAIGERLGYLPLALAQTAAYANEQALSLQALELILENRMSTVLERGQPIDYRDTVATTWNLAFEQLERYPTAANLLAVFAYLAPDKVPRELFFLGLRREQETVVHSTEAGRVEDGLARLLSYALITPASEESLDVHRLVQQVIRERLSPAARDAALSGAIGLLFNCMPLHPWNIDAWPLSTRLAPHVLVAVEHAETAKVWLDECARLLNAVATHLEARGNYGWALAIFERAIRLGEECYGADDLALCPLLNNMSTVLGHLAEFGRARDAQIRALEIQEEHLEGGDGAIASTLINLGGSRASLKDYEGARKDLERALAIQEEHLDAENPEIAKTLGNLGVVLRQLGLADQALPMLDRALKLQEAVYGADHVEVARTQGMMAMTVAHSGELDRAVDLFERCIAIQERGLGAQHPELIGSWQNLGAVLATKGDVPGARQAFANALSIASTSLGAGHPWTELARTGLSLVE